MDLCIVNMLSLSEAGVDLDKDKELNVVSSLATSGFTLITMSDCPE